MPSVLDFCRPLKNGYDFFFGGGGVVKGFKNMFIQNIKPDIYEILV